MRTNLAGIIAENAAGPSFVTDVFTATGIWTCPADVTTAFVELWGGGGSGGGGVDGDTGGGGGGGGAFASVTIAVTPNADYLVTVGVGGAAADHNTDGNNGTASLFESTGEAFPSTPTAVYGRAGNMSGGGGSGGSASESVGDYTESGIAGDSQTSGFINGANGGNVANADIPNNFGIGGGGGSSFAGTGQAGRVAGAGGGGARATGAAGRTSGAGARGEVRITYTPGV